ncbi:protein zyg-11 homolog B-like [Anneissia japonica]|uniref:protein zyg-11 homolog B-like n=1 Tax=Anneissia japonica TaxID=1529436 RepID=UPI0014258875|nr:protein zyg-11 homolog B-like [Anneissia japonica]
MDGKRLRSLVSPSSLVFLCLEHISDNLEKHCKEISLSDCEGINSQLVFRHQDVFLHSSLAECLLQILAKRHMLNDLVLSLFSNPSTTQLSRVNISGSSATLSGLKALSSHRITDLDASRLSNVNFTDIIVAQGQWTRKNIKSLNVSGCTFNTNHTNFCIVIPLSQLKSLLHLNVSYTEFNNNLGLEMVAEKLTNLVSLDISGTYVYNIQPLLKLKHTLRSLIMFKTRVPEKDLIPVLMELKELRYLDISEDAHPMIDMTQKPNVCMLLFTEVSLPNITGLDISGRDNVRESALVEFLDHHPNLKFLGLTITQSLMRDNHTTYELCGVDFLTDESHPFYRKDLQVSGHVTEKQVLEGLRRYTSRGQYVHKLLCGLFSLTQYLSEPRPDIVELVLPGMRAHSMHLGVQMAASACLYNLTKLQLGEEVHPSILKSMIELTLKAMRNFPDQQQLQKNALLTMCSDRILQDVDFDRFQASRMVMDCLFAFDDQSMIRMAVAICSILAAKISTKQTAELGTKRNMQKLLQIVKQKADMENADIILKFTLSALWNLTDESPSTCAIFVNEGGLELFIKILQSFPSEASLQTKVLGLVNNIAEVKHLRHFLLRGDFIDHCRKLLGSGHLEVSYFAAGIIAHLAHESVKDWGACFMERVEILNALHSKILSWENPESEMVAYRSFSPFFPLLERYDTPEVQLWSVWAMHHVCTKNASRYCSMLLEEGGVDILQRLVSSSSVHPDVQAMAHKVLQILLRTKPLQGFKSPAHQ